MRTAVRSKAGLRGWAKAAAPAEPAPKFGLARQPVCAGRLDDAEANPFAGAARASIPAAFADDDFRSPARQPICAADAARAAAREGVPRKLALLDRGRGVFGSYAKVLLVERARRVLPVRAAVGISPRPPAARAVPAAARRAVAGSDHVHRLDRRGACARATPATWPKTFADLAGARLRGGRGISGSDAARGRDERRDAGVLARAWLRHCRRRRAFPGDAARARDATQRNAGDTRSPTESGVPFQVVVTQPASSAEESAQFQGIELHQLLRTIVVRRGENDYLFVLCRAVGGSTGPSCARTWA